MSDERERARHRRRVEEDAIKDAVRAEMRAGGKPATAYFGLDAARELSRADGIRLTNEIMVSIEERLVELEKRAGLA